MPTVRSKAPAERRFGLVAKAGCELRDADVVL
jgi:hypothetical protein